MDFAETIIEISVNSPFYGTDNSIIVKILQDAMRKNKRENKLDWFVKK